MDDSDPKQDYIVSDEEDFSSSERWWGANTGRKSRPIENDQVCNDYIS